MTFCLHPTLMSPFRGGPSVFYTHVGKNLIDVNISGISSKLFSTNHWGLQCLKKLLMAVVLNSFHVQKKQKLRSQATGTHFLAIFARELTDNLGYFSDKKLIHPTQQKGPTCTCSNNLWQQQATKGFSYWTNHKKELRLKNLQVMFAWRS